MDKYRGQVSQGTNNVVNQAVGYLVEVLSPAEQGEEEFADITVGDTKLEGVPTRWKATICREDGSYVAWWWPGHKVVDDDGVESNELGINIIQKGVKFDDLFEPTTLWKFYKDDSRRSHIDPVDA